MAYTPTHQSADDILTGLREIIDEADGPVLPTTVRSSSNVYGDANAAYVYVDYGRGQRFMLMLVRMEQ